MTDGTNPADIVPEPQPPSQPSSQLQPPPPPQAKRSRRWFVIGAAIALAVVVAGVVTVVLLAGGGPADEFADASDTFHATIDEKLPQIESKVSAATGTQFLEPSLGEAGVYMREMADAFGAYRASLGEIDLPDGAPGARLIEVLEGGERIVNVSAGGFAKAEFVRFLDQTWPQLIKLVEDAEANLRAAL